MSPWPSIILKIRTNKSHLSDYFSGTPGKNTFYYFRGMLYWIKALDRLPVHREDGMDVISGQCKEVNVESTVPALAVISVVSSSLFFWFYQTYSDCQQINRREFQGFDILFNEDLSKNLRETGKALMEDYRNNSKVVNRTKRIKGTVVQKEYFYISRSKHIIDQIDEVLAAHYEFSDFERDFLINYDVKYRMGREGAEDDL